MNKVAFTKDVFVVNLTRISATIIYIYIYIMVALIRVKFTTKTSLVKATLFTSLNKRFHGDKVLC